MLMSKARKLGCVRLVVSGVMLPKARLRSSWAGLGGTVVVGLDIMIRINFFSYYDLFTCDDSRLGRSDR